MRHSSTWFGQPYETDKPETIFERHERLQAEKAKAEGWTWYQAIPVPGQPNAYTLPEGLKLDANTDYEIAYDIRDFNGVSRVFRIGVRRAKYQTSGFAKPVVHRPSFDETWVAVAETVAKRGTCPRRQVGAVIVDADNQIVATGYNGAPRGCPIAKRPDAC